MLHETHKYSLIIPLAQGVTSFQGIKSSFIFHQVHPKYEKGFTRFIIDLILESFLCTESLLVGFLIVYLFFFSFTQLSRQ